MIQLNNLQNLKSREGIEIKRGRSIDIYRTLAILQTYAHKLYATTDVAKLGWNPELQKEKYLKEYNLLYAWANKKQISDNKKWRGERWKKELSDVSYNKGVNILNQAIEYRKKLPRKYREKYSFWYEEEFGVFGVPPEKYELINQIACAKHKSLNGEIDLTISWKDELANLIGESAIDETKETKQINKLPLLVSALVFSILLVATAIVSTQAKTIEQHRQDKLNKAIVGAVIEAHRNTREFEESLKAPMLVAIVPSN